MRTRRDGRRSSSARDPAAAGRHGAALADRTRERGIDVAILRVAGGDGSFAVVAAAALGHGIAFVRVPARNHFPLDLGVDRRDLVGSLDAFTEGVERPGRRRGADRPALSQQRLARLPRRRGSPAGLSDAKARALLATAAKMLEPSAAATARTS